ncbi:MAG: glycosyltransferase family 2 protein [Granulosicoccus sp.]
MASPLVSVVIPTHGRGELLSRAIHSVLAQTQSSLEIIVVDDNGRGTEEQLAVEQIVRGINHSIRYEINETNQGGGYTRNSGVAVATGQYIGFLDDDDEWLPEFVEFGLAALEQSKADVVYCDCFVVYSGPTERQTLQINNKHSGDVWAPLVAGWCPRSTSLFLMNRSVADEHRLFDPALASFQDYDCWLTLARRGHQFTWYEKPLVRKHEHSQGQITTNTGKRRQAINVFGNKWLPTLQSNEQAVFRTTLQRLEKDTYRTDFALAFKQLKIGSAIKNAIRYVKTGQSSAIDLYRLLRSLR